jgi:hypothetical protein
VRNLHESKVAITIVGGAICRIFTCDPVNRRGGIGICTEHDEVVVSLATRGINTFLVIQAEH